MGEISDTIVARATPPGIGSVSIVRISGAGAADIGRRAFRTVAGGAIDELPPRTLHLGDFLDHGGQVIDRGLGVLFRAPASFTGEDVLELHCHGNPLIVDRIVEECVAQGCRPARAGEFSLRAFVNGRMDLVQAEALGELIAAESRNATELAQRQLAGELSKRYTALRGEIVEVIALLELELDFTEEGFHFVGWERVCESVQRVRDLCSELLRAHQSGFRFRRGPRILLAGRPNAGKSSLFNAFLGYSRALVSSHAGTTRDYLEERVSWGGVVLHIIDSAGIRDSSEDVEAEGVRRAMALVEEVDLVLYLVDADDRESRESAQRELSALSRVAEETRVEQIWTKCDRGRAPEGGVTCSIYDDASIERLLDRVVELVRVSDGATTALISDRQVFELREILGGAERVLREHRLEPELLSADLRELLAPLDRLVGTVTNEDVLDRVFASFCIGK